MADNVLGLYFEIAADPSNAQAKLKEFQSSVEQTLGAATGSFGLISSDIEQRFGFAQGSITKVGVAAQAAVKDLAYLGAGVVGIGTLLFAAAEKAAHFAEQIGHVAEKSGATAEQVSTLKFAADRVGVSFELVDRSLSFLAKNLGNLGTKEGGAAARALADIGVKGIDAEGHLKPMSVLLPQIVEGLGKMQNGGIKTADSVALFSRGGRELIPVLNEMRQGFKQVEDQARSMGLVISNEDVLAARTFLLEQRTLTAELQGFGLTVGRFVMPWLKDMFIELQHYPLVLEHIKLRLVEVAAIAASPFTFGVSLAALIPLQKAIAASNKEMDQAFTDSLIALDREAGAALAAGINIDKHSASTKAAAKTADEFTASLAGMLRATREETSVLQSEQKERQGIVNEYNRSIQAADRDFAAALKEAKGRKDAAAVKSAAEKAYNDLVLALATERDLKLRQLDDAQDARFAERWKKQIDQGIKLREQERQWTDLATAGIHRETEEIKALDGAWAQTLARQTGISTSTLRMIHDTQQMGITTTQLRQEFIRTYVLGLPSQLNVSRQALTQWANDAKLEISTVQIAVEALRETFVTSSAQMAQAIGTSLVNAVVYQKSIGAAMAAALKATLASLAGEAAVRAIMEIAAGFAALGAGLLGHPGGFPSAAMHFTSAAIYGGVAAGAALAAYAIPSGGTVSPALTAGASGTQATAAATGSTSAAATGPMGAGSVAPGASGQQGAAPPEPSVVIHIHGDFLATPNSAAALAAILTDAVRRQDVILQASHVLRPPPAGR